MKPKQNIEDPILKEALDLVQSILSGAVAVEGQNWMIKDAVFKLRQHAKLVAEKRADLAPRQNIEAE